MANGLPGVGTIVVVGCDDGRAGCWVGGDVVVVGDGHSFAGMVLGGLPWLRCGFGVSSSLLCSCGTSGCTQGGPTMYCWCAVRLWPTAGSTRGVYVLVDPPGVIGEFFCLHQVADRPVCPGGVVLVLFGLLGLFVGVEETGYVLWHVVTPATLLLWPQLALGLFLSEEKSESGLLSFE